MADGPSIKRALDLTASSQELDGARNEERHPDVYRIGSALTALAKELCYWLIILVSVAFLGRTTAKPHHGHSRSISCAQDVYTMMSSAIEALYIFNQHK